MAMSKELKIVLKQLENMSVSDLRFLNETVVDKLRSDRSERIKTAKKDFEVDSLVSFSGGRRGMRKGRILKINRTTATVIDTDGLAWRVALTLLRSQSSA